MLGVGGNSEWTDCLKLKIPLNKLVEIHLRLPDMQTYKNYTYNFTLNHCTSASNEIFVFGMKKKKFDFKSTEKKSSIYRCFYS